MDQVTGRFLLSLTQKMVFEARNTKRSLKPASTNFPRYFHYEAVYAA